MISPPSHFSSSGCIESAKLGSSLIDEGALAVVVLAGGDGSRLGYDGPKGTFPVTLVEKKSLFQLIAEKVKAASPRPVPVAVMTSPSNHDATKQFFVKRRLPGEFSFFMQSTRPLLDVEKRALPDESPDGNGYVFHNLARSGIWQHWKRQGVRFVHIVSVDNPLADPCDAELLGFHAQEGVDVTIKATRRKDAQEKAGVIAEKDGKLAVVEYCELTKEIDSGFQFINTGLFCFSGDFVDTLLQIEHFSLPIHLSRKKHKGIEVFKQESFIFDLFAYARSLSLLVYPREEVFAPLKNLEGEQSVASVKEALLARDRKVFEALSGHLAPKGAVIELDPALNLQLSKRYRSDAWG